MVEQKEPKKDKIQELVDRVHSGLELISDEDLNVLFEETEQVAQSDPTKIEPTPTPAPNPADATPPVVKVGDGQAELLNEIPDKFREKDNATGSIKKMVKANQDLEAELTRKSQELSQLQSIVNEISRKPLSIPNTPVRTEEPTKVEPEEVIDDATFFDKPTDNTVKLIKKYAPQIAKEILVAGLQHYDTYITRRQVLDRFKSEHSDFDNFRSEVVEVCKEHPEWDNDVASLPKIYSAAKEKAIAKARALNPQVANTLDIEKLKADIRAELEDSSVEKARLKIIDEIKKRKAAAGILTSGSPVNVSDRLKGQPKATPMTDEEKIFDDMLKSGYKGLDINS